MGIWESIAGLVRDGVVAVEDAATLTKAAIGAYHDYKASDGKTPADALDALRKHSADVLPILETVVALVFPGAGSMADIGLELVGYIITHAHTMSPEEEQRWMDRASGASG